MVSSTVPTPTSTGGVDAIDAVLAIGNAWPIIEHERRRRDSSVEGSKPLDVAYHYRGRSCAVRALRRASQRLWR